MTSIPLSNNYSVAIEPCEKLRLRLIVYKNDEEYVCRKESLYWLKQFLALDEGRAFRGRLQLLKHGDDIAVEVKGELIGTVSKTSLQTLWKLKA
jgi:hypothetical protein